ncbi:hypothetical protein AMAG_16833 [Allomyces macrogynus ATCC 38327]|uniref:ubiquitinyl hydrolase 1 n=1 Tax=Allomyces macrogynus (strain ATCC 38327) TaxID=578462 RepID=A0A0L0TCT6_ALLM3|nr:hypothetical protein AMAG_16833 [Allomyces macrogynus ATCC 38327]|eukprot:KNE72349.1 hypothetical protein AMAG_16833 [Allomyces macrogynus ATCC 38327]
MNARTDRQPLSTSDLVNTLVTSAPAFASHEQQDAYEALTCILKATAATSFGAVLVGTEHAFATCTQCGSCTKGDVHPFSNLVLSLFDLLHGQPKRPLTLRECLDHYFNPLHSFDRGCQGCGEPERIIEFETRNRITVWPPVLIILLERWRAVDASNETFEKLHNLVRSHIDGVEMADGAPLYDLLAIVNHHGPSRHRGHYTAAVRAQGNGWLQISDERVERVARISVTETAYLLFFKKRDAPFPAVGTAAAQLDPPVLPLILPAAPAVHHGPVSPRAPRPIAPFPSSVAANELVTLISPPPAPPLASRSASTFSTPIARTSPVVSPGVSPVMSLAQVAHRHALVDSALRPALILAQPSAVRALDGILHDLIVNLGGSGAAARLTADQLQDFIAGYRGLIVDTFLDVLHPVAIEPSGPSVASDQCANVTSVARVDAPSACADSVRDGTHGSNNSEPVHAPNATPDAHARPTMRSVGVPSRQVTTDVDPANFRNRYPAYILDFIAWVEAERRRERERDGSRRTIQPMDVVTFVDGQYFLAAGWWAYYTHRHAFVRYSVARDRMSRWFRENEVLADPANGYARKSAKKDMWMVTLAAFDSFIAHRLRSRDL